MIGHGKCHVIIETTVILNVNPIKNIINRIAGNVEIDIVIASQDKHLKNNQANGVRCGDNGIFCGIPLTDEQIKLSKSAHDIYEFYTYIY